MLHAVNTQHGLQRIGPSAIARLGIKRLDDSGHILPWQNLLHAGEENLFSGLTALSAEFTIGEGELMAHDVPLGCAPDEYDDLISGTCSHLPCLNPELNIYLRESEFPELKNYIGDDLIVTDGTSLLGADDKAALAAIMNALQFLISHPEIRHGEVKVGFVPDEEQGLRGAKAFDVSEFGADFGYTLDCCGIGEFVYENWNAGDAEIIFTGQSAHPMSAKGKLKNSLLMAHKFISMLPGGEAPEYTEGREGYYWVKQLQGNSARTVLKLDIRDFSEEGYHARKTFVRQLAESACALWGEGSVICQLSDRYANVFNSLQGEGHYPIDIALRAYQRCGITPTPVAMRGGYDGAVLSQKGLPCPNIFTGAHNFHSIYEYLPVRSLRAASDVVIAIIQETFNGFTTGNRES